MRSYCKAKPAAGYEREIVGNGLERSVGFGLLVFCQIIVWLRNGQDRSLQIIPIFRQTFLVPTTKNS